MGHALRQHRRRKLLGLGHEHLATLLTVQEHLRHLRALPRACAPADEHDFVLLDRSQYAPFRRALTGKSAADRTPEPLMPPPLRPTRTSLRPPPRTSVRRQKSLSGPGGHSVNR